MDSRPLSIRWLLPLLLIACALPGLAGDRQAKDRLCLDCHDEMEAKPILSIYQTRHGVAADTRTPTCQACHGDSTAHAAKLPGGAKRPPSDIRFLPTGTAFDANQSAAQSKTCLQCHDSNTARHWQGSAHEGRGLACTSCHTLHTARDRLLERSSEAETCFRCHPTVRAETHRPSSHPVRAGKLRCSDCHAAHGGEGDRLLRHAEINDTCHRCHADKRGPFLWEHAPVSDNCLSCHTPHGSSHAPLLKARQPWLCQQCHSSNRHPSTAYSGAQLPGNTATPGPQIPLHSCANCHSRVHGSNHPSGARLLR